jgi:hypothetical protein
VAGRICGEHLSLLHTICCISEREGLGSLAADAAGDRNGSCRLHLLQKLMFAAVLVIVVAKPPALLGKIFLWLLQSKRGIGALYCGYCILQICSAHLLQSSREKG